LQIKNRVGKPVWVSLSVEPVRDQNGKTIRSRSILVDISGRKRAEEALRRAHEGVKEQVEQRTAELAKANQQLKQEIENRKRVEEALRERENNFRALAENAHDGILLSLGEDAHDYANKRSCEITGYSQSELFHGGFKMIMHPDELPHIRERHDRRMAGKHVSNHYETRIVHKDGRVVPIEVSSSKTMWQGQAVVMAIIRDITERKRMEAAQAKSHDQLEQRVEERTLELMEAAGELESEHKELLHHKKELEKVNRELVDTNKALSVLARNIDRKREEAEKKISVAIGSKIIPVIEGLKNDKTLKSLEAELDILIASLNELTPSLRNGAGIIYSLSATELRVATMIKNGLTSPEIARLLHVSLDTIKTHRRSIRRKLNISNSKINTASYLRVKMG
jgi:PAS domain S-box-containing protein